MAVVEETPYKYPRSFSGGLAQFWLERRTVTAKVTGSSPVLVANKHSLYKFLQCVAQLGLNVSKPVIRAVSLSDRILGYEPREVGSTPTLRAKDVGYVNYTE